MRIELCIQCRRRYTAETVCVPCQNGEPKPETASKRREAPHNLDLGEGLEKPAGATLAVFKALDAFAFLTPHCNPSEDTIAEYVGIDRRTVVRAKAWLREHGWIDWERQWWTPQSRWQHCHYTILAGWCRPLRKTVLDWLDKRRSKANVSLRELPTTIIEKETQRSKGRRVRKPWLAPYVPRGTTRPPSKPPLASVTDDFIERCGNRERAIAFATWTPLPRAA